MFHGLPTVLTSERSQNAKAKNKRKKALLAPVRRAAPQEAPTDFPHRAQRHHSARLTLTPREQPPATHVARETNA